MPMAERPKQVRCDSCSSPMSLKRVVPRVGGMAELHTYQCAGCGNIVTEFADDPFNAGILLIPKRRDVSC